MDYSPSCPTEIESENKNEEKSAEVTLQTMNSLLKSSASITPLHDETGISKSVNNAQQNTFDSCLEDKVFLSRLKDSKDCDDSDSVFDNIKTVGRKTITINPIFLSVNLPKLNQLNADNASMETVSVVNGVVESSSLKNKFHNTEQSKSISSTAELINIHSQDGKFSATVEDIEHQEQMRNYDKDERPRSTSFEDSNNKCNIVKRSRRRSSSRNRRRSTSRERKRSISRDRRRSISRDKRRSSSRERWRSTSRDRGRSMSRSFSRDKWRSTSRDRGRSISRSSSRDNRRSTSRHKHRSRDRRNGRVHYHKSKNRHRVSSYKHRKEESNYDQKVNFAFVENLSNGLDESFESSKNLQSNDRQRESTPLADELGDTKNNHCNFPINKQECCEKNGTVLKPLSSSSLHGKEDLQLPTGHTFLSHSMLQPQDVNISQSKMFLEQRFSNTTFSASHHPNFTNMERFPNFNHIPKLQSSSFITEFRHRTPFQQFDFQQRQQFQQNLSFHHMDLHVQRPLFQQANPQHRLQFQNADMQHRPSTHNADLQHRLSFQNEDMQHKPSIQNVDFNQRPSFNHLDSQQKFSFHHLDVKSGPQYNHASFQQRIPFQNVGSQQMPRYNCLDSQFHNLSCQKNPVFVDAISTQAPTSFLRPVLEQTNIQSNSSFHHSDIQQRPRFQSKDHNPIAGVFPHMDSQQRPLFHNTDFQRLNFHNTVSPRKNDSLQLPAAFPPTNSQTKIEKHTEHQKTLKGFSLEETNILASQSSTIVKNQSNFTPVENVLNTNLLSLNRIPQQPLSGTVTSYPPVPPPPIPLPQLLQSMTDKVASTNINSLLQTLMSQAGLNPSQPPPPPPLPVETQQNSPVPPPPPSPPPTSNIDNGIKKEQFNKLINSTVTNLLAALQSKQAQIKLTSSDKSVIATTENEAHPPPPPILQFSDTEDKVKNITKTVAFLRNDHVSDDVPRSVDIDASVDKRKQRKDFPNRKDWQERIAEEVKIYLRPFYLNKKIDKEEYKELLKKIVTKISRSGANEIQSEKIQHFVIMYYKKGIKARRNDQKQATLSSSQ